MSNPRDLLLQRLAELLWVERTLAFEVLPDLQKEVKSQGLARALEEHLEQTRGHVGRLEHAFRLLEAEPSSARDEAAASLKSQHDDLSGNVVEPRLKDLFHAQGAMHTEHLELAGYESAILLARAMDAGDAADLLEENRREDEQALELVRGEADRLAREATE